jgi:SAM-dependent methyltransferase
MNIFFEIHQGNLREGPGDRQSTRRALSFLQNLSAKSCILDIGCGPGMQTIDLAIYSPGKIIALDNHQPYLDQLRRRAVAEKLSDRITIINSSMFDLKFAPASFDVIWSEGAIYIIGFEKGLREWKKFLKAGGYLVASEIAWFREDIPDELRLFWEKEYPAIKTVSEHLKIVNDSGYELIAHFPLPESAWWQNYYFPIEKKISRLEVEYAKDTQAMEAIKAERDEMELYRKYSKFYGYEFYIMQK